MPELLRLASTTDREKHSIFSAITSRGKGANDHATLPVPSVGRVLEAPEEPGLGSLFQILALGKQYSS
jgi:hypothetical protein